MSKSVNGCLFWFPYYIFSAVYNSCLEAPAHTGIYQIQLNVSLDHFPVYCDQEKDGGGCYEFLLYFFTPLILRTLSVTWKFLPFGKMKSSQTCWLVLLTQINKQINKQTNQYTSIITLKKVFICHDKKCRVLFKIFDRWSKSATDPNNGATYFLLMLSLTKLSQWETKHPKNKQSNKTKQKSLCNISKDKAPSIAR